MYILLASWHSFSVIRSFLERKGLLNDRELVSDRVVQWAIYWLSFNAPGRIHSITKEKHLVSLDILEVLDWV